MGPDTNKTFSSLSCPAQQTGGFLTDLKEYFMKQRSSDNSRSLLERLPCSPLPVPPSRSFYFAWTAATFLMTLSVKPAYEAVSRVLPLSSSSLVPLTKRKCFRWLCSIRQLTGLNRSQLKNHNGFKPRPWNNNCRILPYPQLQWFHVKY